MANSKSSGEYYQYATVDADPSASGYWTNSVGIRGLKVDKIYFSIRETEDNSSASVATVTLQFKCPGDDIWTNFVDDNLSLAIGNRLEIADNGAIVWRAGVAATADFTSGSITFGFDW